MTGNLYALLSKHFPADRNRPCIETAEGRIYTYADVESISGRIARLLGQLGVGPGERVAAQVEKSPETIFLYLATLRAGAIYLPLNTAYTTNEVAYFLGDAAPRLLVCHPESEAALRPVAERAKVDHVLTLDADGGGGLLAGTADLESLSGCIPRTPEDTAAILYTSGTTGQPKGAMLSHRNLGSNAVALHKIWGFRDNDVLLHALPLYHTHGLFVATNCVLLNGTRMLFLSKFDASEVIRLLPRATVMMGVPTFYTRLLARPTFDRAACAKMRLFISGSAPLREETFHAFEARTGHRILERYGMTETGMNTSNPLDGERRPGTVGLPLPGVEARVTDDEGTVLPTGEIGVLEVRGPNVFSGYWRQPEKTASEFRADGFFITGDVARIDERGYVHIVGRAKDLIISGGLNIYPKEVEQHIDALDGVLESAVIGVEHPDFGEAVAAVVVRANTCPELTGETIAEHLKGELANFKIPKQIFFVDELPRNSMGKVQKNLLRKTFGGTPANT
jgi:malonyl-CoA/methylmalonyl-CoA synthetase